jgi:hypothetical protein
VTRRRNTRTRTAGAPEDRPDDAAAGHPNEAHTPNLDAESDRSMGGSPMRHAARFAAAVVAAVVTMTAMQATASAATAIEYGLIAATMP